MLETGLSMILRYAPTIHFDRGETVFPRAVGYTVFQETAQSASFPKRTVAVPEDAACVIEYAYYFDYDIEHMYDLEHIWVTVGRDGGVTAAEASFHGKYLVLLVPGLHGSLAPAEGHVQAFCQPGKHAFLPAGDLFRLVPGWDSCCRKAGGPVLIGNPFSAAYTPTGKDAFVPTEKNDAHSIRYLQENLAFQPTLEFMPRPLPEEIYMPWPTLYGLIPRWIADECRRLNELYKGE